MTQRKQRSFRLVRLRNQPILAVVYTVRIILKTKIEHMKIISVILSSVFICTSCSIHKSIASRSMACHNAHSTYTVYPRDCSQYSLSDEDKKRKLKFSISILDKAKLEVEASDSIKSTNIIEQSDQFNAAFVLRMLELCISYNRNLCDEQIQEEIQERVRKVSRAL